VSGETADSASALARAFTTPHPALVVYLMAGYPDREGSLLALEAVSGAGADLIELGVPYTDPIADGPVIREAAEAAREAAGGTFGLAEAIDLAAEFTESRGPTPPLALMTYANPLLQRGFDRVAVELESCGVSGTVVPDLPPDSPLTAPWLEACRASGLDNVFLAAPTSTDERLRTIVSASSGFVYCVSTTGVTGERSRLPEELAPLVRRLEAARDHLGSPELPIAVGFGVSDPTQAGAVARMADGVIVGSACVRRQSRVDELAAFVKDVAVAVHEARE
jgi:tryptophan synthase alpha chain